MRLAGRPAGRLEPEGSGIFKLKKISWLDRQRLYRRSLDRSRNLVSRLAVWNQELRSPARILETLGLAEADLGFLKALSGRPQGWHPFEFDPGIGAEAGPLAALGLVCLSRWRRRVSLTGAGRVLLLLTSIDPKIKKARPETKAD